MTITFGQIAGLIAALAFLILVVYICTVLRHLVTTVKETNASIQTLTKDASSIAGNVDELLKKTNTLMDDVNKKAVELDPLFKTAAELSESVSDLNAASRLMADKVVRSTENVAKTSTALRAGRMAFNIYQRHKQKQAQKKQNN